MKNLIRQLGRAGRPSPEPGSRDADLLAAYVVDGDAAAFAAIVDRHGPMVYAACRRLLTDPNDADDAFQAVFLVLVRKAGSIRGAQLAGWLYGVALRTARAARKIAARRGRLDEKYRATRPPPVDEATHPTEIEEVRVLLDRELDRLGEAARAAIVLCDVEGRTRKEAAEELGWPEGTLATRLARARALLAARLTRAGITMSVPALIVLLARDGRAAVPHRLGDLTLPLAAGAPPTPAVEGLAKCGVVGSGFGKALLTGVVAVGAAVGLVAAIIFSGSLDPPRAVQPEPPEFAGRQNIPKAVWPSTSPYRLIATADGRSVAIRDVNGKLTEEFAPATPLDAVVSPDGRRYLRVGVCDTGAPCQLFVGEFKGGKIIETWLKPGLGKTLPWVMEPSWSPDGKRIIFLLDPKGPGTFKNQHVVMVVDADGRNLVTVGFGPESIRKPKLHPDGKRWAALHDSRALGMVRPGRSDEMLLIHDADGNRTPLIYNRKVVDYAFHPEGCTLAASVPGTGLVFLDLESRNEVVIPPSPGFLPPALDADQLIWRPDGRVLAYRPVMLRGKEVAEKGSPTAADPAEPPHLDKVGFVCFGESVGCVTFRLDPAFRLSHWMKDPLVAKTTN